MTFEQGAEIEGRDELEPALGQTLSIAGVRRRRGLPKLLSLFSGAGGMDLGFHQAGYRVALAIDASKAAISSFKHNFPKTKAVAADLTQLGPNGVLELLREQLPLGSKLGVIGGPPCQGFSRANTGALSTDPRNSLPKLYLEIVENLQQVYDVQFLVIENVMGITDKKHSETYSALVNGISGLGFSVTESRVCALDHGVPQTRNRVILTGLKTSRQSCKLKLRRRKGPQYVYEAIAGLAEPEYFKHGANCKEFPVHPNHWTMNPRSSRFDGTLIPSSTRRSFKMLTWKAPSPTIAFGNREIHVHPSGRRRLSVYEAMLLQGFPTTFELKGNFSEQVLQISNAVPPPLARSVALAVSHAMEW